MVYQEYVVSFDHNYSLYNIDEGNLACDCQVFWQKKLFTMISLNKASYGLWNENCNTTQIPSLKDSLKASQELFLTDMCDTTAALQRCIQGPHKHLRRRILQ